jgi:hypothetical protein
LRQQIIANLCRHVRLPFDRLVSLPRFIVSRFIVSRFIVSLVLSSIDRDSRKAACALKARDLHGWIEAAAAAW